MKATDILRNEHEVILDVLAALESISRPALAGEGLDLRSAQEAVDFLRGFGDGCHHGKEERLFFPALAALGLPREVGPLAVMTSEHEEGRGLLAAMADALAEAKQSTAGFESRFGAAAARYVGLMRSHIDKENGVLFPMGDGMLSDTKQAELLREMEGFERADMGEGTHARFLGIASALGKRLGIERVPRASAAHHGCCGHDTRCT